jgi:heat shock protein HslJ
MMTRCRSLATLSIATLLTSCGFATATTPAVQSDVALDGGTWVLTDGTVDGRTIDVPQGSRITLTREEQGRVGGSSACNGYGATVDIDGERVSFSITGGGLMGCADEVMAAERHYLEALPRTTTATRQDARLSLSGPDVALTFELSGPVAIDDITGIEWELDSLIEGGASTAPKGEPATLLLREDGTVIGSTGCRELHGRYDTFGDQINFPEFGADGDCPGELQEQDNHIIGVLGDGFGAQLDGQLLHLTSDGDIGLIYTVRD